LQFPGIREAVFGIADLEVDGGDGGRLKSRKSECLKVEGLKRKNVGETSTLLDYG
jgi:hypothetical protein